MEFSVLRGDVCILEKEELDLPHASGANPEGVGLGPVPAVGQGDFEHRPSRTVDLDGLVESRRGVVNDSHPDEVDTYRESDCRGLTIDECDPYRRGLRYLEARGIRRGVPTRTCKIELGKWFSWSRRNQDIHETCSSQHHAGDEPYYQYSVETNPVAWKAPELKCRGKPLPRGESHSADVGDGHQAKCQERQQDCY